MTKSPKGVLPTKRQVIAELNRHLEEEHRWLAMIPHYPKFIHRVRCLEMALQIVKEWKQPRRGR